MTRWHGGSWRCTKRCWGAMADPMADPMAGPMADSGVWLVTGGAGYIGGHTVARLHAAGRSIVVLDDLSTGLTHRVPAGVPQVFASVLDTAAVARALREHDVAGVIHF